jgi:hypothetical protein
MITLAPSGQQDRDHWIAVTDYGPITATAYSIPISAAIAIPVDLILAMPEETQGTRDSWIAASALGLLAMTHSAWTPDA